MYRELIDKRTMDPKEALWLYASEKWEDSKNFVIELVPHDPKSIFNAVLISLCTSLMWYGILLVREEYLIWKRVEKRKSD